jgi:hypothetical protein
MTRRDTKKTDDEIDGKLKLSIFMGVFIEQYQNWMYMIPKDILFDELFKIFPEEMKACADAMKDLIKEQP